MFFQNRERHHSMSHCQKGSLSRAAGQKATAFPPPKSQNEIPRSTRPRPSQLRSYRCSEVTSEPPQSASKTPKRPTQIDLRSQYCPARSPEGRKGEPANPKLARNSIKTPKQATQEKKYTIYLPIRMRAHSERLSRKPNHPFVGTARDK